MVDGSGASRPPSGHIECQKQDNAADRDPHAGTPKMKPGAKLGVIAMKQHCAAHLPAYMIPDTFVFMDKLPATSTGKVDFQALIRQAKGGST
ncbi:MAG: hypothetical protein AMXMBFR20_19330 [Planctomycetia bacterium]|jgi:acyl-CoA synthetase (AMP-forming)/AMP-acid ligase II|nr:hypothetical protein [Planctomycetota bacterium]OQY97526.1 MAG: hypothetical protein B6D36_18550 [Planctomycetes bacterium UTPLA1]